MRGDFLLFSTLPANSWIPEQGTITFTSRPVSVAVQFMIVIPESEKMDGYDYDELKPETPGEKHGLT